MDDANIKHDAPIPLDDDPINKQKRINILEKYRQLLLRAAKVKEPMRLYSNQGQQEEQLPKTKFMVMFDLSKRLEKEYIPRSAERVIWASMNA